MRYLMLNVLLLCIASAAIAQDYAVSKIPDSLVKNADAVKRSEEIIITVKDVDKVIVKRKYAITILNERGIYYSYYRNNYSIKESLDITGTLYDSEGKKLKTVKRKDINDVSFSDGISLMNDERIKVHSFGYSMYPFTVEYEEEQTVRNTYSFMPWVPVDNIHLSVMQSSYTIEYPADYQIRYKELNIPSQPVITKGNPNTITWKLNNYAAITEEPYQPSLSKFIPLVYVGPTEFFRDGFKGSMKTWEDYGKFQAALNAGRDVLPENVKAEVHRLTDNVADPKEKTRLLYEYMQNHTRYISIQLGIGGLQPFEAKYVAEKKYGDCKALSNYMIALLKEAGIKSHFVVLRSGDEVDADYLKEDFPFHYFNHAICCVPLGKDTMWLECTSQNVAAGYMGSSNGNRKVFLITDDGGKIVSTPVYKKEDNLQLRNIDAVIDETGQLTTDVKTHFTGQQQENVHNLIHYYTAEEKEKYLNRRINLPTYKIEKFEYKENKGVIPSVDEYLKITAPNYAAISGKRLFVVPNLFNRSGQKLSTDKPRKFPFRRDYSYKDVDTIRITVPQGYKPESLPKDVVIKNKFGNYSISFKVNANIIEVLRISECDAQTYPASDFADFAKFQEDIFKADRSKIVLVKE